MNIKHILIGCVVGLSMQSGASNLTLSGLAACQQHPCNGLVDILVTFTGESNDVAKAECFFVATNNETKCAVPVEHITCNLGASGVDDVWTRKFVWDAKSDVGMVKIDDVALTVKVKIPDDVGGVQLWEDGPYWAECNVGATKPEESGYYFWWGDTIGYKRNANNDGWISVKDSSSFSFSSGNCSTYGKNNSQLQSEGYIDEIGNLVTAHDAAAAHLGMPWRMPTDAEFSALISNCTTTWTNNWNGLGVNGRLVTGKGAYSSKSIFLPAAGYGNVFFLYNIGSEGLYWSSTPYSDSYYGQDLCFNSGCFDCFDDHRYGGQSVRPVRGFTDGSGGAISGGAVTTHFGVDFTNEVAQVKVTAITAQQRYPRNGLVDIIVTMQSAADDVPEIEWSFAATNGATKAAIPVEHITQNGEISGSGTTWKCKFIWDAAADIGAVKIDDVALAVTAEISPPGVQLWDNGPYWAKCNVGATKPEECGYYFWWGDTVGYKRNANNNGWVSAKDSSPFSFPAQNCPTDVKDVPQLKSAGYIDSTGNLVAKYDAATTHLGAPWRMPTIAELYALHENCETEWMSRNGVFGRLVKGRGVYASKSIFLPADGLVHYSDPSNIGSQGYYWSSTPVSDDFNRAWGLYFDSGYFNRYEYCYRRNGQSVRPVRGFADGSGGAISGDAVTTHFGVDFTKEVDQVKVTDITAQQRYPWNGLVDITVTMQVASDDANEIEWSFVATNSATKASIPVAHITPNGETLRSGTTWIRKFIWDAKADVGAVKVEDVAITVGFGANVMGGVQLWEDGPYWAECNVGAAKPEEYGYYFWWGDTVGYDANTNDAIWASGYSLNGVKWASSTGVQMSSSPFSSSTCPTFINKTSSQLRSAGYIDSTGCLVAARDAASAHLGAPWRMPTDAEFLAIFSNCTTTWTTRNGVNGRLVKGKGAYASKSIFLPAAGYSDDSRLLYLGSEGYFWSSTPYSPDSYGAWGLDFNSGFFDVSYDSRNNGLSVRAVRGFATNNILTDGGWTTHLSLDCRAGAKVANSTHPLVYNAAWYEGGVTAKIAANGREILSGISGSYAWMPSSDEAHLLTLDVYSALGKVVGTESVLCLSREDLTDLVVPEGMAEIGEYAFAGWQFISASLPSSLTHIADGAFANCRGLTTINVPIGVSSIGKESFYGCNALATMTIHKNVTAIGSNAFSGCCLATVYVDFGDSTRVKQLLSSSGCSVTNVEFVESDPIGDERGPGSWTDPKTGLTWEYCDYYYFDWDDETQNGDYVCDGGITIIKVSPNPVGVLQIPASIYGRPVRSVDQPWCYGNLEYYDWSYDDDEFLNYCDELTAVIFPDTIKEIGGDMVRYCPNLTSVYLPEGLISIGKYSFTDCGLTSIEYPSTLESDISFIWKSPIVSASIRGGNNDYFLFEDGAMYSTSDGYLDGTTWSGVVVKHGKLIGSCRNIQTLSVREGCVELRYDAAMASSVQNVFLPKSLKKGDGHAFSHNLNLRSVCFSGRPILLDGNLSYDFYNDCPHVTTYVPRNMGWEDIVTIGTWQGRPIRFLEDYKPSQDAGAFLPVLPVNATTDEIRGAFVSAIDQSLKKNITDIHSYRSFRAWAGNVGEKKVQLSPFAWMSYALNQGDLLSKMLMDADLKVEGFKPVPNAAHFEFIVDVNDIAIGPDALSANLKTVFGVEGSTTLGANSFSEDAVDIEFVKSEDGKLRFTAGPKEQDSKAFFMKMKIKE